MASPSFTCKLLAELGQGPWCPELHSTVFCRVFVFAFFTAPLCSLVRPGAALNVKNGSIAIRDILAYLTLRQN